MLYAAGQPGGQVNCQLFGRSPDGHALVDSTARPVSVSVVTWRPVFDIEVPVPDDCRLTCLGETASYFGVGAALGEGVDELFWVGTFALAGGAAPTIAHQL